MTPEKPIKPLSDEEWCLRVLLALQGIAVSVEKIADAAERKLPQDDQQ